VTNFKSYNNFYCSLLRINRCETLIAMLDTRTTTTGRKNPNTPREYDNERKRKVV